MSRGGIYTGSNHDTEFFTVCVLHKCVWFNAFTHDSDLLTTMTIIIFSRPLQMCVQLGVFFVVVVVVDIFWGFFVVVFSLGWFVRFTRSSSPFVDLKTTRSRNMLDTSKVKQRGGVIK